MVQCCPRVLHGAPEASREFRFRRPGSRLRPAAAHVSRGSRPSRCRSTAARAERRPRPAEPRRWRLPGSPQKTDSSSSKVVSTITPTDGCGCTIARVASVASPPPGICRSIGTTCGRRSSTSCRASLAVPASPASSMSGTRSGSRLAFADELVVIGEYQSDERVSGQVVGLVRGAESVVILLVLGQAEREDSVVAGRSGGRKLTVP